MYRAYAHYGVNSVNMPGMGSCYESTLDIMTGLL